MFRSRWQLHFLLFGHGQQTWEYSPAYALRSYVYVGAPALLAKPMVASGLTKIQLFYALRVALALAAAFANYRFYLAVKHHLFGPQVAASLALFLAFCTGPFIANAGEAGDGSASYARVCSPRLLSCVGRPGVFLGQRCCRPPRPWSCARWAWLLGSKRTMRSAGLPMPSLSAAV
jgi:hypothetical protein